MSPRREETVRASVPRQRAVHPRAHHRGDVVAVIVSGDPAVNTVLAGAKIASDAGQPLDLVMFTDPDRSLRSSMVVVDHALTVARTAFPRLEVMVDLGLSDARGWERLVSGQISEVVVGSSVALGWEARPEKLPVTVVDDEG